ncbi:hypothetical protein NIES2101_13790 [Calothrix sp. HK-06]|nr:hypothetical protein NIES2101_13790 [Calothrix sp. HK-06]
MASENILSNLFDVNPELRTASEWRHILSELVVSLSSFIGLDFEPVSWYVQDDKPGYSNSSNSVDIKAQVHTGLALQVCGVLCLDINFGEAVWASCDLLLFTASGHRLTSSHRKDLITLTYFDEQGWQNRGWTSDANYEWKSHTDNQRWD